MELRSGPGNLAMDNQLRIEKTAAMKITILAAFFLGTLAGCFERENTFSVGQCVHAVDGGTSYKLTAVGSEKMSGKKITNKVVGAEISELPSGRIYSEVPCPE